MNEEEIIERCLNSLYQLTKTIVVIDGGSTDNTPRIVSRWRSYKRKDVDLRMYRIPFNDHFADQKNWAVSFAETDWVFVLDSDEVIESDLVEELKSIVENKEFDAVAIPRINYLNGKKTEVYPDHQYRFFRQYCRYIYAVHEELVGYRNLGFAEKHIVHAKSMETFDGQQDHYEYITKNKPYALRYDYEE